jgi:sugar phosphate isomerase/epimerase
MPRPVTLFTGQWADLSCDTMIQKAKSFGYDGVELACWGDHFEVDKGRPGLLRCQTRQAECRRHAVPCHLHPPRRPGRVRQHRPPPRADPLPRHLWRWQSRRRAPACRRGAHQDRSCREAFRRQRRERLHRQQHLAPRYSFPPNLPGQIEAGYADFAKRFKPILDEYQKLGIRYALEVHPTEIAFDIASAERALQAVDYHPAFGFNYDPSHFGYQGVDYVKFIYKFSDRIFHVHMKDVAWGIGDGTAGVFGGHVDFHKPPATGTSSPSAVATSTSSSSSAP